MGARAPYKSFVGEKWVGGRQSALMLLGHLSIHSQELKQWAFAAFVHGSWLLEHSRTAFLEMLDL